MNKLQNYYSGKRILVTGHTGFKGSWLTFWLNSLGAKVIGISKDIPTNPSHFELLNLQKYLYRDYRLNILDQEKIFQIFQEDRPEIVFHLAAQPLVRQSYEAPLETFQSNTLGTINILEAIRLSSHTNVAVIVTSDKCYKNVEWEFGYRENDELGGNDPYSASKACAEIVFKSYSQSFFQSQGKRLCTARAGNVIGGGDWAQDRICPDTIKAWSKNTPAIIRNPNMTRPWQHVLEALAGYLWLGQQLAHNDKISGSSFNFGPPDSSNHTVLELVELMQQFWPSSQYSITENKASGQKHEASLLKLNCDRAHAQLGWYPVLGFNETVEMMTSWYYQHNQGESAETLTKQHIDFFSSIAGTRGAPWITPGGQ